MFLIRADAHTRSAERVQAHLAAWSRDVGQLSDGWLGLTAGVDTNGHVVVLARYATEEMALITHDLPESERWWQELESLCDDDAIFCGSAEVTTLLDGGTDDAALVVVATGAAVRRERATRWEQLRAGASGEQERLHGGLAFWLDGQVTECWYVEGGDGGGTSSLLDDHLAQLQFTELIELADPVLLTARTVIDEPSAAGVPT